MLELQIQLIVLDLLWHVVRDVTVLDTTIYENVHTKSYVRLQMSQFVYSVSPDVQSINHT